MKKIISYILTLVMLVSALSFAVSADNTESKEYAGMTWTYNSATRVLTISGTGPMGGFNVDEFGTADSNNIPIEWRNAVKIVVEEGVTGIGHFCFQWFDLVKEVSLPKGIVSIGEGAFYGMSSLESLVIPNSVTEMYYPFHSTTPPKVIVFTGDAPSFRAWPTGNDLYAEIDVYYSLENKTWTEEIKAEFNAGIGGGVRWNGKSTVKESVSDVFNDVLADAWYINGIQYAYDNGIMNGMGNGSFATQGNLTREQFMQVLYTLEAPPPNIYTGNTGFKDVKLGYWYSQAVAWAKADKITSGVGEKIFGLGQFVTREQLATFIKNYVVHVGCEINIEGTLDAFEDADKVSDWAVEGMRFCVENGIIKGKTTTTLDPKGYATRAELAQMLSQFLEAGFLYRVDFDDKNADSCTCKFKYIASGAMFGNTPHAEKEGFFDAGWWYGDIKIWNNTRLEISGHITVTKRWCNGHRVSFHPEKGELKIITKYVDIGEPLGELPVPTREGYTFEGWLYEYDGESFIVSAETVIEREPNTSYLLRAQWKPIEA